MRSFLLFLIGSFVQAEPGNRLWELPWIAGSTRDIIVRGENLLAACGPAGLVRYSMQDGRLSVTAAANTLGNAERVFLHGSNILVWTQRRILQTYREVDDGLEPRGNVFLGAWDITDLAIQKDRLFFLRKTTLEKKVREKKITVDLYFAGKGILRDGHLDIEGELPLGVMQPHRILPVNDGKTAIVTLGDSGLGVIDFGQRPPKVADFITDAGDVRTLSFQAERFIVAGGPNRLVTLDWDAYREKAGNPALIETVDLDLDADPDDEEIFAAGGGDSNPLRTLSVPGMPVAFASEGGRIYFVLDSGEVHLATTPELGSDVTHDGKLASTPVGKVQARSAIAWSLAMGSKRLFVGSEHHGIRAYAVSKGKLKLADTVEIANSLTRFEAVEDGFQFQSGNAVIHVDGRGQLTRGDPTSASGNAALKKRFGIDAGDLIKAVRKDGHHFLLIEDTFETPGRRPVPRVQLLAFRTDRGKPKPVGEYRSEGTPLRHLTVDGDLAAVSGRGTVRLIRWKEGKQVGQVYGGDIQSLALYQQRLLVSGNAGLRVFDVRVPGEPIYLPSLGRAQVRRFALNEGTFFGFTGNTFFGERQTFRHVSPAQTAFEFEPVRKSNGAQLTEKDVSELYGSAYRILDDGTDVCSERYIRQRGYRLTPVARKLDDASGYPDIDVEPDTVAIDMRHGRLKFSSGTSSNFERLSAVATPMYHSAGWDLKGNRLYVATGENANPFVIYDVSDPSFPKEIGWCPGGVRFPSDVAATDDNRFAYLPVTYGSLDILNVENVRGSAYEKIRTPAKVVCSWMAPGAKKTFKLELNSGGGQPAKRLTSWRPPGGDRPVSAEVVGNTLYVAASTFFYVLSLEDPSAPRLMGQCPGGWGHITAVSKGLVYLSANGLTIIDVKDPGKPRLLSRLSEHNGKPLSLLGAPAHGFAAMAFSDMYRSLHFVLVDVRDPGSPKVVGIYENEAILNSAGAAILAGGRALLVDAGSWGADYNVGYGMHGRLILLDVSDPKNIREISTFNVPDEGDPRSIKVSEDEKRAWVGDRSFGVWCYDISNLAAPRLIGAVPVSGESDYGYLKDGVLFSDTTAGGGVWAVDVSDPYSPKKVGYYWDGIWTPRSHHQGKGNALYLTMARYGLKVLDIANPSAIRLAKEIRLNLASTAFKVKGDRLYAMSVDNRRLNLVLYDLSDPLSPVETKRWPLPVPVAPTKFDFIGDDLVTVSLPNGGEQLRIFRFDTEDGRPIEIAKLDLSSAVTKPSGWNNWNVQAVGDRVYFYGDGLSPSVVVVDVGNRKSPSVLWASPLDTGGRMMDARVVGSYLYANWYYPGTQVYDFSNAGHPIKIASEPYGLAGEFSTDAWSMGVVSGPYLYSPKLSFTVVFKVPRSSQTPVGRIKVQVIEK